MDVILFYVIEAEKQRDGAGLGVGALDGLRLAQPLAEIVIRRRVGGKECPVAVVHVQDQVEGALA